MLIILFLSLSTHCQLRQGPADCIVRAKLKKIVHIASVRFSLLCYMALWSQWSGTDPAWGYGSLS